MTVSAARFSSSSSRTGRSLPTPGLQRFQSSAVLLRALRSFGLGAHLPVLDANRSVSAACAQAEAIGGAIRDLLQSWSGRLPGLPPWKLYLRSSNAPILPTSTRAINHPHVPALGSRKERRQVGKALSFKANRLRSTRQSDASVPGLKYLFRSGRIDPLLTHVRQWTGRERRGVFAEPIFLSP